MWWIVGGVILLALLLLAVSLFVVAGRVRPLRRALRRLRVRADQAQRLQRRGVGLQSSLLAVQEQLEEATNRAEQLRS